MVPEDLLFWLEPLDRWVDQYAGVLCRRHADAMVVPRGWFLDDRREPAPRLFRTPTDTTGPMARPRRRRAATATEPPVEQLEFGSQLPPPVAPAPDEAVAAAVVEQGPAHDADHAVWRPAFDVDDDLDGLLEADSPLLARAFRGTDRPKR